MNNFVEVRSLSLLKEMSDAKLLSKLRLITKDVNDPDGRPIYMFLNDERVIEIKDNFINTYGDDNRSTDKGWEHFNPTMFYANQRDNHVITRNYSAVTDIISEGYGSCLCFVFKHKNGRHGFIFVAKDIIRNIKNGYDAKAQEIYQKRMAENKESGANE